MAEKDRFELVSPYKPTGDQPQAIEKLAAGVLAGDKEQTLAGRHRLREEPLPWQMSSQQVQPPHPGAGPQQDAGSPALHVSFKEFFPDNAVEYFVILLRLLPARGLYSQHRYLYRKGQRHQ